MRVNPQHEPLAQYVQAFRHDMHQYPELSHQEFETTRKIRAELEKEGIRILDLPLKTGLVAEIGRPETEPLVVLRADIDALPIEEESGVAFSSHHQGVMHACGHDFHTSAALGAAILLKRAESELKGRVRILFQAAEETGLGAPDVIAAGALDGATAIFGIHNDPTLPVGVIGGKDGALTAGVDRFEVKIAAKGCHAAKPHEGNDPIVIVGQLIGAVQTIVSRSVPSDNSAVVSITQVHSGSTWNVIPDTAYLEGTVRTFSAEARGLIEQRFRQIVAGIASTYGAEIELLWHAGPPSVVNTPHWVAFSLQVASDEGFEARRVESSPIGEDFSFYQQKLPGTFMMVGSGGPYALHHPKFRVDDRALFPTAHYLYSVARRSLEQLSQEA
ncbi:amidohydrolase [Lonsdalea populi]|uniref:amidohydrolase n=1 Tax=Lonsdalea populi TaxID=1172565 RepID=UPI000A22970D|nr:amidohydrolase [Lonsdalea populi]OSM95832.1 hydrolase [Lonsdalea populi]RAT69047.1 hydrolase [Lonsdalea populi]RAT71268.1 hydrolase [Lonsdalea populi]RAT75274.1 hydrolase [Lonsdalea populi]RAT75393.1 hydrolase [Lonsdalea populi]